MNILILYGLRERKPRKTILDSLYCFSEYDKKNSYYYLNILDIKSIKAMCNMKKKRLPLSAIIVHYSAIAQRYDPKWWNENKSMIFQMVKKYDCTKIIIPQDEYNYTDSIREFIKETGTEYIFTCAYEEDYQKLYPEEIGYRHIETVFTGYIDEKTLLRIQKKGYNAERKFDIGYRARKLPYWLGRHAQIKYELSEVFLKYLNSHDNNFVYDIVNTGDTNAKVLFGEDWIDFLLNCRTVLGCLGGSGLLDRDGSVAKKVNEYCQEYPEASFEEVEEHCFKGMDNYIHLFALSPRHFECAMTKTCQVLVEGDYRGVFLPDVDYIELKQDFSNLSEVIKKIEDVDYCKEIAENCYEHVVLSQKYTYSKFVQQIIQNLGENRKEVYLLKLNILCKMSKIRSVYWFLFLPLPIQIRKVSGKILSLLGITKFYKFLLRQWHKIKKSKKNSNHK